MLQNSYALLTFDKVHSGTIPSACHAKQYLNLQKWSKPLVFWTFWLRNVLRTTTACNFSSLIWPAGSIPTALASLLFDPPEPQIIEKKLFHDFPTFSRSCIFFLLTLSLLLFSLLIFSLLSTSALLCFSSVHFVGSLTSKLPSTMDFSTLAVFCEHRYFENGHGMQWGRGPKHIFNGICRGFCAPSFSKLFFLEDLLLSSIFPVPWPTVGTSPCRHCSFSTHTDMLGWTTVGWAGHRCVSSHGYKWSLCTMPAAYQFAAFQQLYSVLASSFLAFCEWIQSDSVWPVQLMRKHIDIYIYVPQKVHSVSTRRRTLTISNISTHVPRKVHIYITTRISLHVHEPEGNISTHVPRKVHSESTRMSLHVHEPEGNISTHVPRRVHSVSTRMSLPVHGP